MKVLKKQYIVVYNSDNIIVSLSENNSETYVPDSLKYAEFDSKEALDAFVSQNELKHEEPSAEDN